jgi:hypothetical protein
MDSRLTNVISCEFEQLVGGHGLQALFAVLYGFQSSAVQAGLAEPSGGVMLGV